MSKIDPIADNIQRMQSTTASNQTTTAHAAGAARPGPTLRKALTWTLYSVFAVFIGDWHRDHSLSMLSFELLVHNKMAFAMMIATAASTALFFPTLHVVFLSFSQANRKPSTRRRVFIGWSIAMVVLQACFFLLTL